MTCTTRYPEHEIVCILHMLSIGSSWIYVTSLLSSARTAPHPAGPLAIGGTPDPSAEIVEVDVGRVIVTEIVPA